MRGKIILFYHIYKCMVIFSYGNASRLIHLFLLKCMYIFLRTQNNHANLNFPHDDLPLGPSFSWKRESVTWQTNESFLDRTFKAVCFAALQEPSKVSIQGNF